jgi:transposase InsO family protein
VRPTVTGANQEWALDFVHDAAESGRKFRVLSVIDVYTRECLALEVDTSFASRRVTRELEKLVAERGAPEAIRCDNGPEFTSRYFLAWGMERKIELVHIEPGRPVQNAHVESFHGKLRDECLNASWFGNLFEARVKIRVFENGRGIVTSQVPFAAFTENFSSMERSCSAPFRERNRRRTVLRVPLRLGLLVRTGQRKFLGASVSHSSKTSGKNKDRLQESLWILRSLDSALQLNIVTEGLRHRVSRSSSGR